MRVSGVHVGDVPGASWPLVNVTETWPLALEVQEAFVVVFLGAGEGRAESWPLSAPSTLPRAAGLVASRGRWGTACSWEEASTAVAATPGLRVNLHPERMSPRLPSAALHTKAAPATTLQRLFWAWHGTGHMASPHPPPPPPAAHREGYAHLTDEGSSCTFHLPPPEVLGWLPLTTVHPGGLPMPMCARDSRGPPRMGPRNLCSPLAGCCPCWSGASQWRPRARWLQLARSAALQEIPGLSRRQGAGEPLAMCQSLRVFQKELLNRGLHKLRKTPSSCRRGLGALEEKSLVALICIRCALAPWHQGLSSQQPSRGPTS